MDDLDTILGQLSRRPIDDRLRTIETGIFARASLLRERRALRTTMGSLALAALAIGVVGGVLPEQRAAASALAEISSPPPLAPSKLLTGRYEP